MTFAGVQPPQARDKNVVAVSVCLRNVSSASRSFTVNLTTCSSLVESRKFSFFKELNLTQKYSIAAIVSTHLFMHARIEEHATNCRAKQNAGLLLVLTPPDNCFELLHPSIHMQLGLKWNVKVALMRFLLPVNLTQRTRCSRRTRLIILSLSTKHGSARESDRELWAERETETEKEAKRDGEKRLEEALIQETGRSWHKDEKQSSGSPQGLGSMCRHNERSQTYPASLISTIKAIFSAQHAVASPAICKSPHLSPKIKTSSKKRQASGNVS